LFGTAGPGAKPATAGDNDGSNLLAHEVR
jgi:hypothetical protein